MLNITIFGEKEECANINHINSISTHFHLFFSQYSKNIFNDDLVIENFLYDRIKFISSFISNNDLSEKDYAIILVDKAFSDGLTLTHHGNHSILSTFHLSSKSHQNLHLIDVLLFFAGICLTENTTKNNIAQLPNELSLVNLVSLLVEEGLGVDKIHFFKQLPSIVEGRKVTSENHTVKLLHGIRTRAPWTEKARNVLTPWGFDVEILRPDSIINTLKFLFGINRLKIVRVFLKDLLEHQKEKNLSLIAHSYGSFLLAETLMTAHDLQLDIKINTIILNGSIIPEDYNWKLFFGSSSVKIERVVNICGDNDYLPLLASKLILGMGASGTFFFVENDKEKVFNFILPRAGHSSMLNPEFCKKYWVKFLLEDNAEKWTPGNEEENHTAFVKFLDCLLTYLNPPFSWMAIMALIIIAVYLLR